jgi:hypothetical protein
MLCRRQQRETNRQDAKIAKIFGFGTVAYRFVASARQSSMLAPHAASVRGMRRGRSDLMRNATRDRVATTRECGSGYHPQKSLNRGLLESS